MALASTSEVAKGTSEAAILKTLEVLMFGFALLLMESKEAHGGLPMPIAT